MVDAVELFDIAAALETQQIAAMGTAIKNGVDLAFSIARHDHRHLANRRCDIIARIGNLCRKAKEIPGRPLEDSLLFDLVLLGIGIESEWNLGQAVRGPRNSSDFVGAEL